MATWTHRVTTPDAGSLPNSSGATTPAVGDLVVVFATIEGNTDDHTLSGTGGYNLTYTQIRKELFTTVTPLAECLICWISTTKVTSASSGAVTVSAGGAGSNLSVYTVTGLHASALGSAAVRQSGGVSQQASAIPSISFGTGVALTDSGIIGAIGVGDATPGLTAPSSFTEGSDTGYTTGEDSGIETVYRGSGHTSQTVAWQTAAASTTWAGIILELKGSLTNTDKVTGTIDVSGTLGESYSVIVSHTDRVTGTIDITGTGRALSGIYARRFAGSAEVFDHVTTAIGSAGVTFGTIACLVRKYQSTSAEQWVSVFRDTGVTSGVKLGQEPGSDGNNPRAWSNNAHAPFDFVPDDGWAIIVTTKATGTATSHFYGYIGGAWTDGDADATSANGSGTPASVRFGVVVQDLSHTPQDLAVVGIWDVVLTQAQVEELAVNWRTQDWYDNSGGRPVALWDFSQPSTAIPVKDLTSNGANETSSSGTAVSDDGPHGWEYGVTVTAKPTGTITVSGTLWSQIQNVDLPTGTIDISGTRREENSQDVKTTGTILVSGTLGETFEEGEVVFTDRRSGQIDVTGTRRESLSFAEQSSGTITVSGTVSESWSLTYTDRRSGQIDVTGTRREQYLLGTYDRRSGQIDVSGAVRESSEQTARSSGTILVSGSIRETYVGATVDRRLGQIDITGTNRESNTRTVRTTGQIDISGTVSESWAVGYVDRRSGQIDVSGAARESQTRTVERAGTILVSGAIREQYVGSITDRRSGTITVTGERREELSRFVRRSGLVLVSGTITESYSVAGTEFTDRVSGTINVSGTSREESSQTTRRSGAVQVTGTVSEQFIAPTIDLRSGIITVTGTRRESWFWTATDLRTGTVTVSGALKEIYQPSGVTTDRTTGTITLTGTVLDIHGRWDWIDGERWPHDSDSRWGNDAGERWEVDLVP